MDAFNAFNHINAGGPDGNIFGTGHMTGLRPDRDLVSSSSPLRVQF